MVARDRPAVSDVCPVLTHPYSVVHREIPDRALSIDYSIVGDIRNINVGCEN